MSMSEKNVPLTIGRAEALVLFEMLADFHTQSCLQVGSDAERLSLVRLHAALETALVEPFLPEYRDLIDQARTDLAAESGV